MAGRVHIVNTGGTIGMNRSDTGYQPELGYLQHLLQAMPELRSPELPTCALTELEPLLDSANMQPSHWELIAREIGKHYDESDGFVILHGTDTMAYTASALSYMLENLAKPVILTGSQIPLREVRNDARENLIDALMLAGGFPVPEVAIAFSGKLFRGNRCVKATADGLDAFLSPNYPPLGRGGLDLQVNWERVRQRPDEPFNIRPISEPRVAALRIFPGMQAELVRHVLNPPLKGLVLECYGVGNAPMDPAFHDAIREATDRGVVVVVVTQCIQGRVRMQGYTTGHALAQAGALSGGDMTAEAALAKMFYLLGQGMDPQEVRHFMQVNLRGELTPSESSPTPP